MFYQIEIEAYKVNIRINKVRVTKASTIILQNTYSIETIYLSLSAQVAAGTFFMKSPVSHFFAGYNFRAVEPILK